MTQEGKENVVPEKEEQTPTEKDIESIRTELQQALDKTKQAEDRVKSMEDSYKGLQKTVNEKDRKLKEQIDLQSRLDNFEDKLKILAVAQSMGRTEESLEGISEKEKQDLLKGFSAVDERYKASVKESEVKRQQEEYKEKADTIWGRAEKLGLTDNDDDYWIIWDALSKDGNLRKAEVKVNKLEKAKQVVTPPSNPTVVPKETEEQIEARLERKILEKHGLLQSDAAVPSGRSKTKGDKLQAYIDGDRTVNPFV